MCNVTNKDILAGFKTDHSMVTIQVALHTNPGGPGFWKLNTSFLSETEYINHIEGVKDEHQNDKSVNASLLWEMIKLKTREQTLRYAKTKKAKMLREEEELERKINVLQRQIDLGCNNANEKIAINIQLEQKTKELRCLNTEQGELSLGQNADGAMKVKKIQSISEVLKKGTTKMA